MTVNPGEAKQGHSIALWGPRKPESLSQMLSRQNLIELHQEWRALTSFHWLISGLSSKTPPPYQAWLRSHQTMTAMLHSDQRHYAQVWLPSQLRSRRRRDLSYTVLGTILYEGIHAPYVSQGNGDLPEVQPVVAIVNSRREQFTSDRPEPHRAQIQFQTQGQVKLYHPGDPTSRSWCGSRRETPNTGTALCCKVACMLSKPVVAEVCEVKRAACWDLKHVFPITGFDNISEAELSNISFQLYWGFRSYNSSSNNCGEIRMHRFPARASKSSLLGLQHFSE